MTERKTQFISKYNYGEGIIDLDEYVVSTATSCSLNCEYCYLKYSKTPPSYFFYTNLDKLEQEVDFVLKNLEKKTFYFNFGETTECFLSEEHFEIILNTIEILSKKAQKYKKEILIELRTKTSNIKKFLNKQIDFKNTKVIYAATISPQQIIENFEKNTSSLDERIECLKYAKEYGFFVGLRFEPIIIYPIDGITYENIVESIKKIINNYNEISKRIFEILSFKDIHSITLSCLRFTKKQFKYLLEKKSKLCFFEMVLCQDRKYRYSRPIRVTIYREIIKTLKKICPEIVEKILLSFEFNYIWESCNLKIKKLTDINL